MPKHLLPAAAVLLALLSPGARASQPFPDTLRTRLELSGAPACTVCHSNNLGGSGTVTKKFGAALRARGLEAGDTGSLADALTRLEADGVDSDGDGTGDVAELRAGTDPNTGTGTGQGGDGAQGGCAAGPSAGPCALLASLALLALRAAAGRRGRRAPGAP
jgi:hypothetical protein